MKGDFHDMARRLLPLPTAPYCEHFVIDEAAAIAAQLPGVRASTDEHGNLRLDYDGAPEGQRLVVTAHMDHPAMLYADRLSARDYLFEQAGGVPVELAREATVRIYDPGSSPDQAGVEARITGFCDRHSAPVQSRGLQAPAFRVRTAATAGASEIGPGAFAMLDLKPFQIRGDLARGRACDDLAGAAVGLAWLGQVVGDAAPCRCGLLLTRAEEVGFGGMVAAINSGALERDAVYVNVECSSELAGAALGGGPVVRVGDRAWIFAPEVTAALAAVACEIEAAPPGAATAFRYQRRLMDGGTCEATALARAGFTTGAVALPLRHYHNRGKGRLQAEAVSLSDAANLVRLLVQLATRPGGAGEALTTTTSNLDRQMEERFHRHDQRLRQTWGCPRPPCAETAS